MTTWSKSSPHLVLVPPSRGPSSSFFHLNYCKTLLLGHLVSTLDTEVHSQQSREKNLIKMQIKLCQSAQVHHSILSFKDKALLHNHTEFFSLLPAPAPWWTQPHSSQCFLQQKEHLLFPLLGAAFSNHDSLTVAPPLCPLSSLSAASASIHLVCHCSLGRCPVHKNPQ